MAGNPDGKRRLDNLGWLVGSTVQPKKRKEIEGVSATTIIDLQAQLFRAQESARLQKEGLDVSEKHVRRKAGVDVGALLGPRNSGVEQRDQKDRLQLKSTGDRTSECYAALERKAVLYEKLARGEVDDEEDKYEVDFMRKGTLADEARELPATSRRGEEPVDTMWEAVAGTGGMTSADMERERERRSWEEDEGQRRTKEEEEAQQRRQHKETILELARETRESREQAAEVKRHKEKAAKTKLDKLKEAFIKKQVKKLTSSKEGAQGKHASGSQQSGKE